MQAPAMPMERVMSSPTKASPALCCAQIFHGAPRKSTLALAVSRPLAPVFAPKSSGGEIADASQDQSANLQEAASLPPVFRNAWPVALWPDFQGRVKPKCL